MSETLTHFIAVCPKCLVSLRVPHAFSGRSVRCNQCSHKFRTFTPDFPPPPISDEYTTGTLNMNPTSSEAGTLTVVCPSCKAFLSVRRSSAGHHVRCRNCSNKFLIPSTGTSPGQPNQQSHEANLVKQLFRNLEDTKAGEEPNRAGPVLSESEHATVSGLLDRILTEFSMMVEDRDRIQSEHVTLLARFKKLRGKYERLKLEREKDRLEHHRLDAELATLREALTASHDAREQISRQGQDLRDQLETVHAERDQFYQGLHERDEALKSTRAKLEEARPATSPAW